MNKIELYDTTLRDGAQSEGVSFSVSDKLKICEKLDELGIHFIEGGWPGTNPKDMEFFKKAAHLNLKNSKLVAFGSTQYAKSKASQDPPAPESAGVEALTVSSAPAFLTLIHFTNLSPPMAVT